MEKAEEQSNLPMTLDRYTAIKAELTAAQAKEMAARLELLKRSGHTAKGSKTVVLDGFKVAFTNTVNTSIFEPALKGVRETLGEETFASVFVPKYTFSQTGFNALNDEQKEAAEEALSTAPGTPQIKIGKPIAPKEADE
jgi:hypothetical protein